LLDPTWMHSWCAYFCVPAQAHGCSRLLSESSSKHMRHRPSSPLGAAAPLEDPLPLLVLPMLFKLSMDAVRACAAPLGLVPLAPGRPLLVAGCWCDDAGMTNTPRRERFSSSSCCPCCVSPVGKAAVAAAPAAGPSDPSLVRLPSSRSLSSSTSEFTASWFRILFPVQREPLQASKDAQFSAAQ
jgi:hypothetical protein